MEDTLLTHVSKGGGGVKTTDVLCEHCGSCGVRNLETVLWIRIRMDPEFLPGSRSGIIVPDPDPAKDERAEK